MSNRLAFLVVLMVPLGLLGCACAGHEPSARAVSDTNHPPTTVGSGPSTAPYGPSYNHVPSSRTHNNTLHTPLSPLAAATVIAQVFENFDFRMVSDQDSPFQTMKVEAVKGDYFSARTSAVTMQGEGLDAVCRWIGPRATDVRFQSDLPVEQHAVVLKAIEKSLAEASTQPLTK